MIAVQVGGIESIRLVTEEPLSHHEGTSSCSQALQRLNGHPPCQKVSRVDTDQPLVALIFETFSANFRWWTKPVLHNRLAEQLQGPWRHVGLYVQHALGRVQQLAYVQVETKSTLPCRLLRLWRWPV